LAAVAGLQHQLLRKLRKMRKQLRKEPKSELRLKSLQK
jgi:hypothetical protein